MSPAVEKYFIGIMQGRLSLPDRGRIQSFPVQTWRKEFALARQASLDCIEWIYELETEADNPLRTENGMQDILELACNSGVAVKSICADYYMDCPLVGTRGESERAMIEHLLHLIGRAALLGVSYIVLPFVDNSSLRSKAAVSGMRAVLETVLPAAEHGHVELHLETDLRPSDLASILREIDHPLLRANYDIGNSASLGHDPREELPLLKEWIGSVHVKDRVRGGGTVPLGSGAADFPTCFRQIRDAEFRGPFILQAAREEGLSEVELATRNRQFVERHLAAAFGA